MKRWIWLFVAVLILSAGLRAEETPEVKDAPMVSASPAPAPVAEVPTPTAAQPDAPPKPARAWAERIETPGAPNLHRVSDALYRSAQPTVEGFRAVKALGVKTVVNLRAFHSDRRALRGTDLRYEPIPMQAWHPEDEDVVRFLRVVADKNRTPVLVHCQHGADRTGVMVAVYRIVMQGWSREEAIAEMRQGGFGFHEIFKGLPEYLAKLDIAKLRKEAGLDDAVNAEAEEQAATPAGVERAP